MAKYIRLFIVVLLFSSCTHDILEDVVIQPTLELDVRLPIDENGYYHLVLDSTKNQTVHRISGSVYPIFEPTKVEWESNLYWWLLEGQVVAEITKTYFNPFTGQLTYVNLPPLVNWQKALVSTINTASYVDSNNEINTMIAPIYSMRNDTLVVNCKVNEWNIRQTIKIVLD
jgi:beta-glucanase (GH16 family)